MAIFYYKNCGHFINEEIQKCPALKHCLPVFKFVYKFFVCTDLKV